MGIGNLAGSLGTEIAGELAAETLFGGARNSPTFDASKVTLTPSGIENILRSNKLEYLIADILEGVGLDGSALTGGFDNIQDRVEFGRDQAAKSFQDISRTWLEREVGKIAAEGEAARALANVNKSWDRVIGLDAGNASILNNAATVSGNVASAALGANANNFNSAAQYASGLANAIGGVYR